MRWFTKSLLVALVSINAYATCPLQICIPVASCAPAREIVKLVGKELLEKMYYTPIINNSSGLFYREAGSRMVNMAKNEKLKSRAFEAAARLEAQRYFLNKKAAVITHITNQVKEISADSTLLLNQISSLQSEVLLLLISIQTNDRIKEGKQKLLGIKN